MTRRHGSASDRRPGWMPPRVITGTAKGRRLHCPPDPRIRPATDRLKTALFNILFDVEDLRVLDLFAGCGAVGIEALSRGAAHVTFVDSYAPAVEAIRGNLDACRLADRAEVVEADCAAWTEATARGPASGAGFDLVFVDPPYDVAVASLERIAAALSTPGFLSPYARLAYERRTGDDPPPLPQGCETVLRRAYGQTTLFVAEHGDRSQPTQENK